LELVKKFIRIRSTADDDLISTFIDSAIEEFEDYCRVFLLRTTAASRPFTFYGTSLVLDGFEIDTIELRSHTDRADEEGTVIEDTEYTVSDVPFGKEITLNETFDGLISYSANFGFTELPNPIKTALLIRCSTLYHEREETVHRLPTTVTRRLSPYKLYRLT
jgi:hypothetical protein